MRTLEEITKEYQEVAAAYGDRRYKLDILSQEAENLKQKMLQLNQESMQIQNQKPPEKP